jgi:catechol 2,3-dioxygenase-like lactoylglutathione lyase family enzyme
MAKATAAKRGKTKSPFKLASCDVMTFVATAKPAEARKFYQKVLGLRFIADEPYALVFDLNGIMLRIQKLQELAPARHTTMGWKVRDIRAAVIGLRKHSVEFQRFPRMQQDELGIWTSPSGAKVAWFQDPDGNTLSLTEFSS